MKWIEFGILEVANLCGLNIAPYSLGQREVKAQCPFCDDKKHHLNINAENNQWYCFKCGSYGNDVSLYAQIHGISNRDAVRELKKNGLGGKRGQIYTRNVNPAPAMRSLYDRHDVYYELLRMLHLDTQHRNNLISRGLSVENIRQFMYKSVPRDPNIRRVVIRRLLDKYDLSGIPGFYREYGEWKMYVPKTGGFFIPVCDSDGYIQGLQMRLDSGDSRYKWFSTANFPEGTGVQAWTHVVGNTSAKEAFLTEGALKSDVASVLSGGALYIAIPGVNAAAHLPETLAKLNISKVYDVFDMDKFTNIHVKTALLKVYSMLNENGIEVQKCTWNPNYKGIDDYRLYKRNFYTRQAA